MMNTVNGKAFGGMERLGMVPTIMALAVFGVLLLGVCITLLTRSLLYAGATEAVRERVDTNMKVAWDSLKAKGTTFSITDGKLLAGDRRHSLRRAVRLPVVIQTGSVKASATLVDVSTDGGRISSPLSQPAGTSLEITIGNLPVRARIVAVENDCTRLQFALDTGTRDRLETTLTRLVA